MGTLLADRLGNGWKCILPPSGPYDNFSFTSSSPSSQWSYWQFKLALFSNLIQQGGSPLEGEWIQRYCVPQKTKQQ